MNKLFRTLAIAALALALPLAALAQNNLNLDTGAVVSSGGDITFNPGTNIAPVNNAMLADLTTAFGNSFSELASTGDLGQVLAGQQYSTTPIPDSSLVPNEVIAVQTNGGNYAALLVTAASSGSITLQFFTYNNSGKQLQTGIVTLGGPAAPQITMVQNNYSYILPGAPNYGIAPGTLVIILGSALAEPGSQAVLQDPANALPNTLNGASVSLIVNGTTVHPVFYYAIPTVVAVVIPSTTPVGTGTITVSYNNVPSAPFPIQIVAHAFGFDNYGGGLAAATDNTTGKLITTTNSAKPGENIVFWGAGDGADPNNTDIGPPTHYDNLSGITAFYFGSVQVPATELLYQGRSPYQGVDQINVTVPANAPTGCAVSVSAVTGTGSSALSSNFVTLPIAAGGGTCVDPLSIVSPIEEGTLSGKGTVRFGFVAVEQLTDSSGVTDAAAAVFDSISGSSFGSESNSQPSLGSCVVSQSSSTNLGNLPTFTYLEAGTITVTGPPNGTVQLDEFQKGIYTADNLGLLGIPNFTIPASGGTYIFNGSGGADVGAFTASVAFLTPLVWTNASSDGTVTRASGVTTTWTGGASGTYARISGSSASSNSLFSASFICDAPVSAETFTVPPAVLLSLPAGIGSLAVSNYTNPVSVTIPNLDFGFAEAYVSTSIDATYN
ncbi:MAG: hypothetical protein ABSE42_06625 [Bryobacteraceae bacterium]|jgi:uncharacterized protein (TIGR03437 family)